MAFEDYKTKKSVVVVYTGEGKGKTSASVGLLARALGREWSVAYIQFVKTWETGESNFIEKLKAADLFGDKLFYYRGGKGFYNAGDISAKNVSEDEHKKAAEETFAIALKKATSGEFDVVICDEINNAAHDGLLPKNSIEKLIKTRHTKTSLCLTGRNFPEKLVPLTDIATNMTKIKHHFDDKYLANKGIDY
ncbi:cob(I)yrinic acid a,c-diamide adenosyltransferase [bacterium]|nr:cob(I)yrinic acid a,c-diamide adenosyltransferase [bacterium]NBX97945.1 cob(I)yrinic acid a,c-diamide adenosyltransferase [bacterium]NDC94627.1 cob(I)yrinic acid a,c-diamide adenosyltransferase [bacterium]NDD83782.1 cob(I)yrinic acid a,c-diamide adenosyltransferase [bacterium]NDG28811.1 cob(I)yrinic acid a,c-diamide adenosyltransferase [bacterium]